VQNLIICNDPSNPPERTFDCYLSSKYFDPLHEQWSCGIVLPGNFRLSACLISEPVDMATCRYFKRRLIWLVLSANGQEGTSSA